MMPSVAESSNMPESKVDYKQKYKALKKKLKFLAFEQECFMEELRKAQRKLLRISRDRSFLLDRLLQYEKVEESSGDSDATASSDSDDGNRDGPSASKKKKLGQFSQMTDLAGLYQKMKAAGQLSGNLSVSHSMESGKKKKTSAKKSGKSLAKVIASSAGKAPGHMTREELERHLDSKKHYGIERAPALLPLEIFSNENSNIESDSLMDEGEDDTDLIIDVPQ